MSALRILVADDHPIFRLGLCSLLRSNNKWEVCGESSDGRDAVEKCRQLRPDLVILDICMPTLNGGEAARQILRDNPAQRILILTDVESETVMRDCLDAGVRGWISKSDGSEDLLRAVEALQGHNSIFNTRASDLIISTPTQRSRTRPGELKVRQLSPREREVLQLLAESRTSREVGVILNISSKTAETHRSNIMIKLKLHSIAQLVLYAVRNEIVHVQYPDAPALPERANGSAGICHQSLN